MTGPKPLTGVEDEAAIIADLHKQIAELIADREKRIERERALREALACCRRGASKGFYFFEEDDCKNPGDP